MLVGVGYPAVMLFLGGIIGRIGIGVAPLPELLDKLFALFVRLQLHKGTALFIRDDIYHVFVEPLLIRARQLVEQLSLAGFLFVVLLLFGVLCLRIARSGRSLGVEPPGISTTSTPPLRMAVRNQRFHQFIAGLATRKDGSLSPRHHPVNEKKQWDPGRFHP